MNRFNFLCAAALLTIVGGVATATMAPPTADWPKAPCAWKTKVPNASYGIPVIYQDYVIVAGNYDACGGSGSSADREAQNYLFVMNRFSGEIKWSAAFDTCGVFVSAGEGLVFVGAYYPTATVRAYEIQTGNMYWQYDLPNEYLRPELGTPSLPKSVYYRGRVYVTWYTSPMLVLGAQTGVPVHITSYTVGGRIYLSTLSGTARFVTVGSGMANQMYAAAQVDITEPVPVVQWMTNVSTAYTSMTADDYVATVAPFNFSNTVSQQLIGFDVKTGMIAWRKTITYPTSNTNFDFNSDLGGSYFTFVNSTNATTVARVNPDGSCAWKTEYDNTEGVILVAADRTVVLLAQQTGTMFAFDAVTGQPTWKAMGNLGTAFGNAADGYYYYPENGAIVALKSRF